MGPQVTQKKASNVLGGNNPGSSQAHIWAQSFANAGLLILVGVFDPWKSQFLTKSTPQISQGEIFPRSCLGSQFVGDSLGATMDQPNWTFGFCADVQSTTGVLQSQGSVFDPPDLKPSG